MIWENFEFYNAHVQTYTKNQCAKHKTRKQIHTKLYKVRWYLQALKECSANKMDQWVKVVIITWVQLLGLTRWKEELTPISYPLPTTMHTMSLSHSLSLSLSQNRDRTCCLACTRSVLSHWATLTALLLLLILSQALAHLPRLHLN